MEKFGALGRFAAAPLQSLIETNPAPLRLAEICDGSSACLTDYAFCAIHQPEPHLISILVNCVPARTILCCIQPVLLIKFYRLIENVALIPEAARHFIFGAPGLPIQPTESAQRVFSAWSLTLHSHPGATVRRRELTMPFGDRKSARVVLTRGLDVTMVAIDGTWQRSAKLHDVSVTGAKIVVDGSLENLQLREFFLLMSRQSIVYRRCELVRVHQNELGLRFLEPELKPRRKSGSTTHAEKRPPR